jgi:hypothetical protein
MGETSPAKYLLILAISAIGEHELLQPRMYRLARPQSGSTSWRLEAGRQVTARGQFVAQSPDRYAQ